MRTTDKISITPMTCKTLQNIQWRYTTRESKWCLHTPKNHFPFLYHYLFQFKKSSNKTQSPSTPQTHTHTCYLILSHSFTKLSFLSCLFYLWRCAHIKCTHEY
uniref:Uncharacterized protein n=1 Tax=Trypanosoma congolense (strain IL3000) TaxID=1068625 RepID=G0UNL7_TRYCI|nr:hypothetical protein, unlikely [Trypanosoma congolense IL3000]